MSAPARFSFCTLLCYLASGMLALVSLLGGTASPSRAAGTSGLFVFGQYTGVALTSPYSAGGNPLFRWADLEPSPGAYNFVPLDQAVNASSAAGKRLIPRIYTNEDSFSQASPGWFFALPGALSYYPSSAAQSQGMLAPVPWDPVYQQRFGSFLVALGNHYNGNPTIEFFQTNAAGGIYGESFIGTNKPSGWTAALQIQATNTMTDLWRQVFPSTNLALMVNYIGDNIGEATASYGASRGFYLQQNSPNLSPGSVALFTANQASTKLVLEVENNGCTTATGAAFNSMINQIFGYGFPIDYLTLCSQSFGDPATAATLPDVISRLRTSGGGGGTSKPPQTIGVFRKGAWFLNNQNDGSAADFSFFFGTANSIPVTGDWDCNGTKTPGIFVNGSWYLSNSKDGGLALSFHYGSSGDLPVVGDWNGDGCDTVGVFRKGAWFLSNTIGGSPAPNYWFFYGGPSDVPITGDWDGNGSTTVGVFRKGAWYLNNQNDGSAPEFSFFYGVASDVPVTGDWDGNGSTTVGVFRSGVWYLNNQNNGSVPEFSFSYGGSLDKPVTGNWGTSPSFQLDLPLVTNGSQNMAVAPCALSFSCQRGPLDFDTEKALSDPKTAPAPGWSGPQTPPPPGWTGAADAPPAPRVPPATLSAPTPVPAAVVPSQAGGLAATLSSTKAR